LIYPLVSLSSLIFAKNKQRKTAERILYLSHSYKYKSEGRYTSKRETAQFLQRFLGSVLRVASYRSGSSDGKKEKDL